MRSSLQKKKLITQSDLYKDEFERELKMVKEQTNELLKKALIIGGSLAVTYILFRQITASKRKKQVVTKTIVSKNDEGNFEEVAAIEQPSRLTSIVSEIGTTLANEATSFLLTLAKEKLIELLAPKETNESIDEDS